uniref:Uncharacterized protein n=1 Tax=Arion vulgaris TaxID=1028688 RepID=A0A0B7BWW7_9EUPU
MNICNSGHFYSHLDHAIIWVKRTCMEGHKTSDGAGDQRSQELPYSWCWREDKRKAA